MRFVIATLLALLTACGTYRIDQQTSDVAFKLVRPDQKPRPTIYDGHRADLQRARLVVLANLTAISHQNRVNDALQEMYWRCRDLGADVILLGHVSSQVIGATAQPIGFGAYYSTPVYSHQYQAVAYRFAYKSLGFGWNENKKVTFVGDVAAQAGVKKGDEIMSVAGMGVINYPTAQHALRDPLNGYVESLPAGSVVDVELLRQGEGVVLAQIPTQTAPPGYVVGPGSDLAKFIDRDDEPSVIKWPTYWR